MRLVKLVTIAAICFSCISNAWAVAEKIGGLRKVTGLAYVQRAQASESIKAVEGMEIYQNDTITTTENSSLGIVFKDQTRISIGPDSELTINEYIFNPSKKKYSMLTKIMKGTAAYTSGKLSRLSPDSVKIETPDATIGSRGTSFLIKVEER